jgi:hypothetical protein
MKEVEKVTIERTLGIGEVVDLYPETADIFSNTAWAAWAAP